MAEPKYLLKVFLCHASQDKPVVRELYQRLKAEAWIDTWFDEKKLLPGQDWRLNIEEAVETSDIVIICLSSNSVSKEGFIQKEMRYAREIALEKLEESIFLIPLRIDECDVPRGLRFYQWADYFGEKKDETYNALLESLELRYEQKLKVEKKDRVRRENDKLEREAAEKVVREKAEQEANEKTSREKIKRELAEKSKREIPEDRTVRKAETEKSVSKSFSKLNSFLTNKIPFLRIVGVVGIIIIIFWCGSLAMPQLFALIPTINPSAKITPIVTPTIKETSLSVTSHPIVDSLLQEQITEKIKTIYSYKLHGTFQNTTTEGKTLNYQYDNEYVRPNKSHTFVKSEDGQITETILVGDRYCSREGESKWHCDSAWISDEIDRWVEIIMGDRPFGVDTITVIDKGTRTEMWEGKECLLFYESVIFSDSTSEETYELCIDTNTLFPVKYGYSGKMPDNPGVIAVRRDFNVFDINVPIDISLPSP